MYTPTLSCNHFETKSTPNNFCILILRQPATRHFLLKNMILPCLGNRTQYPNLLS
jgi:hypothetical protein